MPDKIMLVPECHVDTALARVLLADHLTLINHQQGITKVARACYALASVLSVAEK